MATHPAVYRQGLAYIGVYAIINLNNDRFYIGSSQDLIHRFTYHLSRLKARKHTNKALQEDFNTFGRHVFLFKPILMTDLATRRNVEYDIIFKSDPTKLYNSIEKHKSLFKDQLSWVDIINWAEKQTNRDGTERI